ncbi:hypothetical protein [Paenibacillus periandrae]|uniref:hypothetical protein n=1 Tax=Paenibacillus periandrae TaxID=1761741 RepID=UPI001F08E1A9|nr:hypothetical protein [Paenibacillus periandrae]
MERTQTYVFSGRFRPYGTRLTWVRLYRLLTDVYSGRFRPTDTLDLGGAISLADRRVFGTLSSYGHAGL